MDVDDAEAPSNATSPPIMIGDDGEEQALQPASPRTTAGVHDWQIIEDGLLSQCGSSPRSLSHQDLTQVGPSSLPASESGHEGLEAGNEDGESLSSASVAVEVLPAESQSEGELDSQTDDDSADSDAEEVAAEASDQEDMLDREGLAGDYEPLLGGETNQRVDNEDCTESPFSDHSSFADVSMPDERPPQPETVNNSLVDSLSASVISEMMAAAEAGSEAELVSESEDEPAVPDREAFRLAMQSALDPQNFPEHMIEERNVDDDIQIISYRPLASESGSQGGSLSRSSSLSTALDRALQPEEPQFSKDATKQCDWFHSAKENSAAKFLHRIWFQLQVVARRAGTCIPFCVRRRVTSMLKCLDYQAAQGGKGSVYLAYGAAFVGFLLAFRYYRECRKLRQINVVQKEAFDMHVLKVLDLNEKLGRGVSIPITQNCGFKDLSFTKRTYSHRPMSLSSSLLGTVP